MFKQPFTVRGAEITVTASIGIALQPARRCVAEELLRDADTAMYQAKVPGGDDVVDLRHLHARARRRAAAPRARAAHARSHRDELLPALPAEAAARDRRGRRARGAAALAAPRAAARSAPDEFIADRRGHRA